MTNDGFAAFQAQYVESAAYHEAGHITAAVVQQMPLRSHGIHVDPKANGIAYYWHREPGDLANSDRDLEERERTIVALYAGRIAQQKFFPDTPQEAWQADDEKIHTLLDEMLPTDRQATLDDLWQKGRELVGQRWPVISALAETLLAKPLSVQPQCEIRRNWSRGETSVEKWMSSSEIVEFFSKFQIPVHVLPD